MVEIELKARVSDPAAVEAALSSFLVFDGKIEKQDEYWTIPVSTHAAQSGGFRVRLRCEGDDATVTFKEKQYAGSLEINDETEFGVMDAMAFRRFLGKMEAVPLYKKAKRGSRWKSADGIIAELVTVEGLGAFLEVEALFETKAVSLDAVRTKLMEVVRHCGLSSRDLEARPYSQLLGIPRY